MGHYLEGHSTSPRVMIPATRAFHQTARSGAHGFRSHRLRSLLMLCKYCRIRVNIRSSMLIRYPKRIADLAIKRRLPSMCEGSDYIEAGCLVSYSSNDTENYRRAAYYVDKILKGTKPADLPVEQPTKFEFVINLKTAKQIGLAVPQSVLYRADRVVK